MKKLVAKYPILYESHQYEVGDELPASNHDMVKTWIENDVAHWVKEEPDNEAEEKASDNSQDDNSEKQDNNPENKDDSSEKQDDNPENNDNSSKDTEKTEDKKDDKKNNKQSNSKNKTGFGRTKR